MLSPTIHRLVIAIDKLVPAIDLGPYIGEVSAKTVTGGAGKANGLDCQQRGVPLNLDIEGVVATVGKLVEVLDVLAKGWGMATTLTDCLLTARQR